MEENNSQDDINEMLLVIDDLAQQIIGGNIMVSSLKDASDLQEKYARDLLDIIRVYDDMCFRLKELLEVHFKKEREENLPVNLNYKRIYKALEEYRARIW